MDRSLVPEGYSTPGHFSAPNLPYFSSFNSTPDPDLIGVKASLERQKQRLEEQLAAVHMETSILEYESMQIARELGMFRAGPQSNPWTGHDPYAPPQIQQQACFRGPPVYQPMHIPQVQQQVYYAPPQAYMGYAGTASWGFPNTPRPEQPPRPSPGSARDIQSRSAKKKRPQKEKAISDVDDRRPKKRRRKVGQHGLFFRRFFQHSAGIPDSDEESREEVSALTSPRQLQGRFDLFPEDLKEKLIAACADVIDLLSGREEQYAHKRLEEMMAVLQHDPEPLQFLKNVGQYPTNPRRDASVPVLRTVLLVTVRRLALAVERQGLLPANPQEMTFEAMQERAKTALRKAKEKKEQDGRSEGEREEGGGASVPATQHIRAPKGEEGEGAELPKRPLAGTDPVISKSARAKLVEGCEAVANTIVFGKSMKLRALLAVVLKDPNPLQYLRAVASSPDFVEAGGMMDCASSQLRAVKKLAIWAEKEGLLPPPQAGAGFSDDALEKRMDAAIQLAEEEEEDGDLKRI